MEHFGKRTEATVVLLSPLIVLMNNQGCYISYISQKHKMDGFLSGGAVDAGRLRLCE